MPFDVVSALATASATATTVKALAESVSAISKQIKEREIREAILDVHERLLDHRAQVLDLKDQLVEAKQENQALREQIADRESMLHEDQFYWREQGNGQRDGPYCTRCYDAESLKVRLTGNGDGWWACRNCKSDYSARNARMWI